ncbi:MAG: beta-N-acetylhexosaminidase [Akkermansia sp.]
MKIFPCLTFLALLTASVTAQENIIPKPAQLQMGAHEAFTFLDDSDITIVSDDERELQCARFVAKMMGEQLGRKIALNEYPSGTQFEVPSAGAIMFFACDELKDMGEESYKITASGDSLAVYYASPEGLLRACASLIQIIEPNKTTLGVKSFCLTDAPRYQWRAVMLDEARHFYGEKAVKDLLGQMFLLKMNVFHWHLTDNDGWRVEIKKYPRLTEISSKRSDTEAIKWKSGKSIGHPHEGFYTQEQIKRIIAYAAERGITIIPEFDVPGHSTAAAVAYPWLSLKKLDKMPTTFGSNLALDPTKESTYEFVSNVFGELAELFPSPIMHFGGDEVRFAKQWKGEPAIEAFMKEKGYTTLSEVQLYFTERVQQIIQSKGKRAMGWNEIMGGDIHGDGGGKDIKGKVMTDTIIHYWDGPISLVKDAILDGHDVVNSANPYTYMDFDYKRTPMQKSYSFNPTPAGLTPEQRERLLGMGVQVWTEWMPTVEYMQQMLFPRLIALSEVAWTAKEKKNYEDFLKRLKAFAPRLHFKMKNED